MEDSNENIIVAKPLPHKSANKMSKRELYATLCAYFPQYTLKDAKSMKARDMILLINTKRKMDAQHYYNLTQIIAAPHSKKGESVKKLLNHFEDIANGS